MTSNDKEPNLFNAPDGVTIEPVILIMIQHHWGRGKTIGEAWRRVQQEAGSTVAQLKRKQHLIWAAFNYITDDEETTVRSYINDMGSTCYHRDYPPHLIDQKK